MEVMFFSPAFGSMELRKETNCEHGGSRFGLGTQSVMLCSLGLFPLTSR